MYNLIEYSDNYSKTSGILWKCCRDQPAVDKNGAFVNFAAANSITNLSKIEKNRQRWHKKSSNNGTIKISMYFLENS